MDINLDELRKIKMNQWVTGWIKSYMEYVKENLREWEIKQELRGLWEYEWVNE